MIPFNGKNIKKATAVLFREQNVYSLIIAIKLFESLSFDKNVLRKNAERFNENIFKEKIMDVVNPCIA